MAKATYTDLLTQERLDTSFGGSGIYTTNAKGTSGLYHDFSGGEVDFKGKGFPDEGPGGLTIEKGTITHAVISYDGAPLITIDGSLAAKQFYHAVSTGRFDGILEKFLAKNDKVAGSAGVDDHLFGYGGNDKINGKAGDDIVNGGKGNDILTGGAGSDVFEFGVGSGKDKITDFDADGDAQDFMQLLNGSSYTLKEDSHGDAMVWLSGKDNLTLVGVGIDEIDGSDFFGG